MRLEKISKKTILFFQFHEKNVVICMYVRVEEKDDKNWQLERKRRSSSKREEGIELVSKC